MLKVTPALTAFRRAVADRKLTKAEAKNLLKYKNELQRQLTRMRDGQPVAVGYKPGGVPVLGTVKLMAGSKSVLVDAFVSKS